MAKINVRLTRPAEVLVSKFGSMTQAEDVADLLELPYGQLAYILYGSRAKYSYRTFQISKRKGGMRTIASPHPTVKILQTKLNEILNLVYVPKLSTHGFVLKRSIVTNAQEHTQKRFVLNVDLENFFPSIHFGRIRGMFMAAPYKLPAPVATVLSQLCCHDKALPQGAPTSPIISNMVCAKLDGDLRRLAGRSKCIYTRYADDITFSTTLEEFPLEMGHLKEDDSQGQAVVGPALTRIIESNGFKINESKVRLQRWTERQIVTGLVVNGQTPNTPKRVISQIRAMVHAWDKFGAGKAAEEFFKKWDRRARRPGSQPMSFERVVRGKLDFIGMVKGAGNRRYRLLRNSIHNLNPKLVSHLPVPSAQPPAYSWSVLFERYRNLVFQLEVVSGQKIAGGTVFAWKNEWLATAAHNLGDEIRVYHQGSNNVAALVVTKVPHPKADGGQNIDAALLRLESGLLDFAEGIPIRSDPISPGEEVAALGFPKIPGHHSSLSILPGIVESIAPDYREQRYTIQVNSDISGGVSGGPVIDRFGRLVGVVMEASTEQATDDVPGRKFRHVLPAKYLVEIPTASQFESK